MAISTTGAPHAGAPRPAQRPAGRVGSEEYHSAPLPPAQEAAVLYAANLVAPAEAILKGLTRDPASRTNKQPWLMLFDLFELTQNRSSATCRTMRALTRASCRPTSRNEISVGGQNPRYNAIEVDGISTNDSFGLETNNMPTPREPFSMDTIEEISVDVANYDVTVSGGVGGVINP